MTVVVGFVGPDGAVMASDSEATEGSSGHTRLDVEKCWRCGGLLMGYTGSTSVKQPLAARAAKAVAKHFGERENVDRWEAREALRLAVRDVLQRAYQGFVPSRPGLTPEQVLAGAVLVIGRDDEGYWLLEIDHQNTATFYTERSFHTVGSGSPAAYVAHGLMKHYEVAGRSVSHLKLVAYRTVDTCISVLGGPMGVGGSVQLWYSDNGGAFARASDDECSRMATGVAQWTTIERESLDRVVVEQVGDAGDTRPDEVELPEAIEEDASNDA